MLLLLSDSVLGNGVDFGCEEVLAGLGIHVGELGPVGDVLGRDVRMAAAAGVGPKRLDGEFVDGPPVLAPSRLSLECSIARPPILSLSNQQAASTKSCWVGLQTSIGVRPPGTWCPTRNRAD